MSPNGSVTTQDREQSSFSNPLPGDDAAWDKSPLGPAQNWPAPLQQSVELLAKFDFPAAIYWTHDLILLHNHAWAEIAGLAEQGIAQLETLPDRCSLALLAFLDGSVGSSLQHEDLLGQDVNTPYGFSVLSSPLMQSEDGRPRAVMVQLHPSPEQSFAYNSVKGARSITVRNLSGGTPLEGYFQSPLDQHPYFKAFAELVPCGLAVLDRQATAIFLNSAFFELTNHEGKDKSFQSWPNSIHDEDYDRVMGAYQQAFKSKEQLRVEFRNRSSDWRLLLLTPLGEDSFRSISFQGDGGFICSIVDITSEKSAELEQRRSAKEARERKKQQERFIDMVSHEIRNPISAVLHCSEDIDEAIHTKEKQEIDTDSIAEAVETINLCISHQKTIVDDILSFSKLDANLLSMTPKGVQPKRQIASSLKMLLPEFRKQHIEFDYRIDQTYVDTEVDWVKADLVRINQVYVNLLTNAIKFTAKKDGVKKITVSIAASVERPTSYPPSIVFFDGQDQYHMDATNTTDWGNGETLYIMSAIKDTGIGISDEGQKRLFERFRQATPKTQEIYGGSGLGLNISRKICQIHGGEIGVSSKEGHGSTFGFFFKVKRTNAPAPEEDSEDKAAARRKMRDHVDAHGNEAQENDDAEDTPACLDDPKVMQGEAAMPQAEIEGDERRERTAKIASEVEEPKPNAYALSERPRASDPRPTEERYVQQPKILSNDQSHPINATNETQRDDNRPIHCLLVEDNIINQRIVLRKLRAKGFTVTAANNGQEAVDAVKTAPRKSSHDKAAFDVVLMDQEMPVLDGNGAARAIRKLEQAGEIEHLKILGVTANVREEQQDEMRDAGMDDVISKPYKIDELIARINKLAPAMD